MMNNMSLTSSTFYTNKSQDFNGYASDNNYINLSEVFGSRTSFNPIVKNLDHSRVNLENTRKIETSELENKVRLLDERIIEDYSFAGQQLQKSKEQTLKVEDKLLHGLIPSKKLIANKDREINQVEENFKQELGRENKRSKQSKNRILENVDEKTFGFKVEVINQQRTTEDIMESNHGKIGQKITTLYNKIHEERKTRQDQNVKLIERLSGQINKMEETLAIERKMRQSTEDLLLKALIDMNKTLKTQITSEKESRERTEGQMLSIVEGTCYRLEGQVKPRRSKWTF